MSYALSAALEVLNPVLNGSDTANALVAAKCIGLMRGYDARWKDAPYKIEAVEQVLTSDLYNPETTRKSRSFTLAGKIDVHAIEIATGERVIFDHKTSSQEIDDPHAPYWRQLVVEGQVSHYFMLAWLNGQKLDKAVWDVIRKPGISPRILSNKDAAAFLKAATYCGNTFDPDRLEEFRADEDGRETKPMYAARLSQDCIEARPNWYFQRRTVPRMDAEVREYGIELWGHSQDLLAAKASGRHPRNSGACFNYSSVCSYLGLCSGHDTVDSGQWIAKPWVHPELPVLSEDTGATILTNSRIRCFQTCRQKHYFRYDLGIEKVDEEEREALYFGTLIHEALERYFLALRDQQQKGAV